MRSNVDRRAGLVSDTFKDAGATKAEADLLGEEPAHRPLVGPGGIAEGAGQVLGQGFGLLTDQIIDSAIHAIPPSVRDDIEDGAVEFFGTPLGQKVGTALTSAVEVWDQFASKYPQSAKSVAAATDIGILQIPKRSALFGVDLQKRVKDLSVSAIKDQQGFSYDRIKRMVQPESKLPDGKLHTGQPGEAGWRSLRRSTYDFVKDGDEDAITNVLDISGKIDPNRTYTYNLGVIGKELLPEAEEKLWKHLGTFRNKWDYNDVSSDIRAAANDLSYIPGYETIVGDNKLVTERILKAADTILKQQPRTARGLRQARIEFDKAFPNSSGIDAADNAHNKTVQFVRNELNSKLDAMTDVDAYNLRMTSHRLQQAEDIFLGKASRERGNAAERTGEFLRRHAHLPSTPVALMVLGSYLATGPVLSAAGAAGVAGLVGWGTWKAMSPRNRNRELARILSGIDKARKSETSKVVLDGLKADRLAIREMMEMSQEEWADFVSMREEEARELEQQGQQ
jgi:hypothetical protein